jgi:thiol:disulfide interchange protein
MSKHIAKGVLVVSFLFAVCLFGSCAKETEQQAAGDNVDWLVSLEEALERAREQERPIMIDVYADWCVWCKRLDSDTYSNKDVVAKAGEFVSLKLDADAHRSWVSRYQVGGLPTILFIDPDGKEIHRVIGYKPPGQFVSEMEVALNVFRGGKGS